MKKRKTKFTGHATKRMQQRGIGTSEAEAILQFADKKVHIGDGSVSWSISRHRLEELTERGALTAQMVDKLGNTCLVIAIKQGRPKVITALHARSDKAGRHYRKFCRRRGRRRFRRSHF